MKSKKAREIIMEMKAVPLSSKSFFIVDINNNPLFYIRKIKSRLNVHVLNNALIDFEPKLTWDFIVREVNSMPLKFDNPPIATSQSITILSEIKNIKVVHQIPKWNDYQFVEDFKRVREGVFLKTKDKITP